MGPLALSAVALAALSVSGFLGGELAYRYGVRVADETTQVLPPSVDCCTTQPVIAEPPLLGG